MDLSEQLQTLVRGHLGTLTATPSGWHKTNCPMCASRGHRPDRRQRFGIKFDAETIGANCFNCGFHLRWQPGQELRSDFKSLLSTIGVPNTDIDRLAFEAYVQRHGIHTDGATHRANATPQLKWKTMELPEDSHSVQQWLESGCEESDLLEVAQYALDRGIEDLSRVWWSPAKYHSMRHRMIVPFLWQSRTVGYTARHVKPNIQPALRYTHSVPAHYVFNLDAQRNYDRCYTILTEGAIDALLVDGISVQHNRVSESQAQLISALHTEIIVCADRDSAGHGLVEAALAHGWQVSFPPWEPGIKDIGDAVQRYGTVYTVHSIINHRTADTDKIRVWRKLEESQYATGKVHA